MAAAEVAVCSRPWHQYDDIRGGERQGIPPAAALQQMQQQWAPNSFAVTKIDDARHGSLGRH